MSFLKALIVESGHILAGLYFISIENRPRPNLRVFQIEMIGKVVIKRRQILAHFLQISCSNFTL